MSTGEREYSLEGYRGVALEILRQAQAEIGNVILVMTRDGLETRGLLIPRYAHADERHIVLKLKSGYNLGFDVSSISSISVIEPSKKTSPRSVNPIESKTRKNVLLLSTGGTIASRVDYRTGAVHPALSAEDLYAAVPELGEISNIHPEVIFSTYSENLTPQHWERLATRIISAPPENFKSDGIVIMLGTDTLGYVSAALSFALLGFDIPVVCVAAQRSSDRPSSDSALNLKAAVRFAAYSERIGVYVAMHYDESDDLIAIHGGTRLRKNHTSRRDAFESIDAPLIAKVKGREISYTKQVGKALGEIDQKLKLKTRFEPKVSLIKFHPGFDPEILDFLEGKQVKGIIFEGTGLGHVSAQVVEKIGSLTSKRVFVGITSQCIWGSVDLNVYDTGRDLLTAGTVSLENMLGETALAKLSWALGNFSRSEIGDVMLRNLAGEVTTRRTP